MGFNPRPHARGDALPEFDKLGFEVSIHAPTRGATLVFLINTPLYGFNPRPHARGDRQTRPYRNGLMAVSIHAPTRGATLSNKSDYKSQIVSIHAPTRGATHRQDYQRG